MSELPEIEEFEFKTVTGTGCQGYPEVPGYKGISGSGNRYTLVREDQYELYRELDLLYDIKSIDQAKNQLKLWKKRLIDIRFDIDSLEALLEEHGSNTNR